LLIDGLSMQEENIASTLAGAMGEIPIIGGSAGDDLHFKATLVYHDGAFHAGGAVLATFFLDHPFTTFKTQHFVPREDAKLVVTEAEPASRIVREINGMPAAEEYARLVGHTVAELNPMIFSKYPVMLRLGGEYYVRSIQFPRGRNTPRAQADHRLRMHPAPARNL